MMGGKDSNSQSPPDVLAGVRMPSALLGKVIPILMGMQRAGMNLYWYGDFKAVAQSGGKKGGKGGGGKGKGGGQQSYEYYAAIEAALCHGTIAGVNNVWMARGAAKVLSSSESYVVTGAHPSYTAANANTYQLNQGVSKITPYTFANGGYGSDVITFTCTAVDASATPTIVYSVVNTGSPSALQIGDELTIFGMQNAANNQTLVAVTNFTTDPDTGALLTFSIVNVSGVDESGSSGTASDSVSSGLMPTPITSSGTNPPPPGSYFLDEENATYYFNTADNGAEMVIGYSYSLLYLNTVESSSIPSGSPYQIQVQNSPQYYEADLGVVWGNTTDRVPGAALTKVNGTPTLSGTYSVIVSGTFAGRYTFAPPDVNEDVIISYEVYDASLQSSGKKSTAQQTIANIDLLNGTAGAGGQDPWTYLETKHPEALLGYAGTAIIASQQVPLGSSAEMPNWTLELQGPYNVGGGIVDCNPASCIFGILCDPVFGIGYPQANLGNWGNAAACWAANSFFISMYIDSQSAAAEHIGEVLEAGMAACFFSEGLFKIVPLSDTAAAGNGATYLPNTQPVATLSDSDFITAKKGKDPVTMKRKAWQDVKTRVQVEFSDRQNAYNQSIVMSTDDNARNKYGLRIEDPQSWHFITTYPAAYFAANMRLKRSVYIRREFSFTLKSTWSFLEPGDIVEITVARLGLINFPVRIKKTVDDKKKGLSIEAEEFQFGTMSPAFYASEPAVGYQATESSQDGGNTDVLIIEVPDRANGYKGNQLKMWCEGEVSSQWGGCQVFLSAGDDAEVSHVNITNGIITVTCNNDFADGDQVWFNQLQNATFLNFANLPGGLTILSTSQSLGQFTAYANPSLMPASYSAADSGVAAVQGDYAQIASVRTPGITGTLAAPIGSSDTSMTVVFNNGTQVPSTSSSTKAEANATMLAIADASGTVEFVTYTNAVLLASNAYQLTGLARGQLGSAVAAHTSGADVASFVNANVTYTYDPSLWNRIVFLKFPSVNLLNGGTQSLAAIGPIPLVLQGIGPGAVDAATGIFRPGKGSIPNAWSGSLVYTSNTNSITWSWGEVDAVTNIAISAGVLTVTCANTLVVNQVAQIGTLAYATQLNSLILIVLSATSSQFTALVSLPNYTSHVDSGNVTGFLTLSRAGIPSPASGNNLELSLFTGSVTITGLTSGTTYYFYPYFDDANPPAAFTTNFFDSGGQSYYYQTYFGGISFVGASAVTGGLGTPAIAYLVNTGAAVVVMGRNDHVPLGSAAVSAATTSSGSGGGSGGGQGGGGGCPAVDMFLLDELKVRDVARDRSIDVLAGDVDMVQEAARVLDVSFAMQPCVRLATENGAEVIVSESTPVYSPDGPGRYAPELEIGMRVITDVGSGPEFSPLTCVGILAQTQMVARINCGGRNFAAGKEPNRRIYTHNSPPIQK